MKVYGTKATVKLIKDKSKKAKEKMKSSDEGSDEPKVKYSKRGFGWSGVSPSAMHGWFWVASDNYQRSLFRIGFKR